MPILTALDWRLNRLFLEEVQYWLTHSGSDATTAEGVFRVELLRHIRDADNAEIDRKQVCLDIVPAQMSP